MIRTSRLLTFGLSLMVLASTGLAQERERPNRPNRPGGNMSVEQWKEQQAKAMERKTQQFMKQMGDVVPEDKKPRLQQIVQIYLVEELKINMSMMAARREAQGDRQAMRKLGTDSQAKVKKLKTQAMDAAEKLLENKKALNAFKKNLDQISPQRQGGQGGRGQGGQGGQGGRGGGGGQGGGQGGRGGGG